jgi:CobQ/CobB/MinD/ParA nucleotide binding domain
MNVTATSKRIIFVTGNKGGTGKTTFARGLLDVYQHLGVNCQAYDSDRLAPQLHRHYPQATTIDLTCNAQQWLESLKHDRSDVVLADMSAGSGIWVEQLVQHLNLIQVATELGWRLTLVSVVAGGKDSLNALQVLLNEFGNQVDYVAVKNAASMRSDSDRFATSPTHQRLCQLQGAEITMPQLFHSAYDAIDEYDLAFRQAMQAESGLTRADRSRVCQWLNRMQETVTQSEGYLGLSS